MSWIRWSSLCVVAMLSTGPATAADIVLRVGTVAPEDSAQGRALNKTAETIAAAKVGLDFKVFHNSQLGAAEVEVQNVKLGLQDGFFEGLSWWGAFAPDLRIESVPFTFTNRDHYVKWLNSSSFKPIEDQVLQNGNQRIIFGKELWWRGPFRVLIAKEPVLTLEDLSKIKLRMPAIETVTKYWGKNGLGANIVNIPFGDVYVSLRQGVVDAVTSPFDLVDSFKFVEVAKHFMVTDEYQQALALCLNDRKYQMLDDAQRKALLDGLDAGGKMYNQELADSVEVWKKKIEAAGGVFHDKDFKRAEFAAKAAALHKQFEAEGYWRPGLIEGIEAIQ